MEQTKTSNGQGEGGSSSLFPSWKLLALAVIGVPVATDAALHTWVFQHPLPALGLTLLEGLAVGVLGFLAKLWQRQETELLDWLDLRIRWFLSGYLQEYKQQLIYWHQDVDAKGIGIHGPFTLEVDDIFVDLSLDPTAPDLASANPIHLLPAALRQGRHSIWEYLRDSSSGGPHLMILGAPGVGKTTLVQHIALTLVRPEKRKKYQAPLKVPVVLFLREHAENISANPEITLTDLIQEHFTKRRQEAPRGWFANQLKQGRCLILLDGLDEVADPAARRTVVKWVETQMRDYGKNRFVITSRPHGYREQRLNNVTVLEVRPFTSAQIRQFIGSWYRATEHKSAGRFDPGVQLRAENGAEQLLNRLQKKPALLDLAVNPLLLTMIATVHRYLSALPGKRVDLYAKVCEVFLGRRQEAKELPQELSPDQKQSVLQPLAYHLMCANKRAISVDEAEPVIAASLALVYPGLSAAAFLKGIENDSGVLLERESGVYEFAHLTFQEYLASVYIKEQGLAQKLLDNVLISWWHETIRLYAAQTDATPILEACLKAQASTADTWLLAIECEEEARAVQPEMRVQVQTLLEQGVEDATPERRKLAARTLLTRRLRQQMTPVDEHRYVATSLITCAEYQLFLDEQSELRRWLQPSHWQTARFPVGRGRTPVLGVRISEADAFCQWLNVSEGGDWQYRLPKPGDIEGEQAESWLEQELERGVGYWNTEGLIIDVNAPTTLHRFLTPEMVVEQVSQDFSLAQHSTLEPALAETLHRTCLHALERSSHLDLTRIPNARDDLSALQSARLFVSDAARTLARDLASVCAHAPVLSLDLAQDREHALDFARTLALDLRLDLSLVFDRVAQMIAAGGNQEVAAARLLRWLIRVSTLLLIEFLAGESKIPAAVIRKRHERPWGASSPVEEKLFNQAINGYLYTWMEFAILEARIAGSLHPFEGILLIKERKPNQDVT